MVTYIVQKIETTSDKQGLTAARIIYRAFFTDTPIYAAYKTDVDTILTTDGCGDCIVTG